MGELDNDMFTEDEIKFNKIEYCSIEFIKDIDIFKKGFYIGNIFDNRLIIKINNIDYAINLYQLMESKDIKILHRSEITEEIFFTYIFDIGSDARTHLNKSIPAYISYVISKNILPNGCFVENFNKFYY